MSELDSLVEKDHPNAAYPLLNHIKTSKNSCTRAVCIVLAILLVMCILATVSLSVALGVTLGSNTTSGNSSTNAQSSCISADCVVLASSMIQKMDTSIDPCVDFYNYSCGGWDANNFLPEGSGYWDILQELTKDNYLRLRQLLDGSAEDEIVAVHYMRELYQTCLDVDTITSKGAQPLLDPVSYTHLTLPTKRIV